MKLMNELAMGGAASAASLQAYYLAQADISTEATTKGTWFDESVDLCGPEGDALVDDVLAIIGAVESRIRKRRPNDELSHRLIVRRVVANGLRCRYFRQPDLVAYGRKADSYRDAEPWLSGEAMSRTVDLLVKAGLLHASVGRLGVVSSTYGVSQKLCEVAEACGIADQHLTVRLPRERLVRLREGNSETPLLHFQGTDQTERWSHVLADYNELLTRQTLGLSLTAEEEGNWLRHRNDNWNGECVRLRRPELIQTDLYRQFNNGSFNQGGRLYGGWWIDAPKALRRKITAARQSGLESPSIRTRMAAAVSL